MDYAVVPRFQCNILWLSYMAVFILFLEISCGSIPTVSSLSYRGSNREDRNYYDSLSVLLSILSSLSWFGGVIFRNHLRTVCFRSLLFRLILLHRLLATHYMLLVVLDAASRSDWLDPIIPHTFIQSTSSSNLLAGSGPASVSLDSTTIETSGRTLRCSSSGFKHKRWHVTCFLLAHGSRCSMYRSHFCWSDVEVWQ